MNIRLVLIIHCLLFVMNAKSSEETNCDQSLNAKKLNFAYYQDPVKAMRYFNNIRKARGVMPDLTKLISQLRPGPQSRILDIGVGSGIEYEYLIEQGYAVDGLDISGPMLSEMDHILSSRFGNNWREQYASELIFSSIQGFDTAHRQERYDLVWALASFLHLAPEEVVPAINAYGKTLKDDGKFFLAFVWSRQEEMFLGSGARAFTGYTKKYFIEKVAPQLEGLAISDISIKTSKSKSSSKDRRWLHVTLSRSK